MKKAFEKLTNSIIAMTIATLILGLVFILYPSMSLLTLGIISAIYLVVHGLVLITLKTSLLHIPFESVMTGILSIILGLILWIHPQDAVLLLTIAFGVWIILSSVNSIKVALFFQKIEQFPSTLMIVLGILDIILGILVILNPFEASITITVYLGIMLILHSIFMLVNMFILKKNIKTTEKFIQENF